MPHSSVHGISQQGYWSGLPFPPPGNLPDPGIKPKSPASPALQMDSLTIEPPGKAKVGEETSVLQRRVPSNTCEGTRELEHEHWNATVYAASKVQG